MIGFWPIKALVVFQSCYKPVLLSSLSKIIIKKRLTCYEQVPVINFHGIVKNGATLKISTSLVTLQNRFTSEMCLQLLSYSQPAIPFQAQCQAFGKKINTLLQSTFQKHARSLRRTKMSLSCQYSIAPLPVALGLVVKNILPTWFPYPSSCHISIFFLQKLINCNKWSGIQVCEHFCFK